MGGVQQPARLFRVPQDDGEAAKWFRKAAEQGSRNAMAMLGVMYAKGAGVPLDNGTALTWLTLAAEQGHRQAQQDRSFLLNHIMQIKQVALRLRRNLDDSLSEPVSEGARPLALRNAVDEL